MTPAQSHVKQFIANFDGRQRGPSLREIALSRGVSIATTYRNVAALIRMGHLERTEGVYRSVKVIRKEF